MFTIHNITRYLEEYPPYVSNHFDRELPLRLVRATSANPLKFNSLARSPPLAVAIRFSIWTNGNAP